MISDILAEAIGDIEEFQREYPALYEPVTEEIEVLKEEMRALIRRLNLPPEAEEGYVARVAFHGYRQ